METDRRGKLQKYLHVQPVELPVGLLDTIFGADTKFILMSGSLTKLTCKALFPLEDVDYKEFAPMTKPWKCPIVYDPVSARLRRDVKTLSDKIRSIYEAEERPNTLVHVTYGEQMRFATFLADLKPITHNKETKQAAIAEFKEKGGILLGAGMAEGVDLPGDYCKLIIVPRLLFPNIGDEGVAKRLAMSDGQEWYDITTVMTFVQQDWRGKRGPNDECKTFVLDPKFLPLLRKTKHELNKGFLAHITKKDES